MDLKQMWDTLPCELTDFVNELALFLTSVCKTHRAMLEGGSGELYIQLCEYILFLTRCPDREVLKVWTSGWCGRAPYTTGTRRTLWARCGGVMTRTAWCRATWTSRRDRTRV